MSKANIIGFASTMLHDWLKKLAPLFHPIRSKTKTNCNPLTYVFPRFASATCNHFEFWLVQWIICVLCDWLERLLWFWFYYTWLKIALTFFNDLTLQPLICKYPIKPQKRSARKYVETKIVSWKTIPSPSPPQKAILNLPIPYPSPYLHRSVWSTVLCLFLNTVIS